jgi:hypothetical protein
MYTVYIHIFLTAALAGGECSASRPCRFTPGERTPGTHWIGGWVGPRVGLDDVAERKFVILPELELRPLGRPARSQPPYRLRYPGFSQAVDCIKENYGQAKILTAVSSQFRGSESLRNGWLPSLSRNLPPIVELEGPLPWLQDGAISFYPEPVDSSRSTSYFFKRHFSITGILPFTKVIQSMKAVRKVKIRKSILKFPLLDMISQWVQRLGYGMDSRVLISRRDKKLLSLPWRSCRFEWPLRFLPIGNWGTYPRRGRRVKLITHLHLVQRSRMVNLHLYLPYARGS